MRVIASSDIGGHWNLLMLADDALFALRPFVSSVICFSAAICRSFSAVWQARPAALEPIFFTILIPQL